MNSVISKVVPGGPCSGRRIYPGDRLIRDKRACYLRRA